MGKNWRQIEGKNPVLECLKADNKIFTIFIEEGIKHHGKIEQILNLAAERKILIVKKGRKNLSRLSQTGSHQGVVAQAALLPEYSLAYILKKCETEKRDPLLIVLPELLYEYNLGAVLRTAEAAGVDAVIMNKRNKLGPQATLAAMGAVEYLPIVKENLFYGLDFLVNKGVKIVAAQPEAAKIYYEVDLTGPIAVLVGSEDKGISQNLSRRVKYEVRIPMLGKITSLNLSAASAIFLYEVLRQRNLSGLNTAVEIKT